MISQVDLKNFKRHEQLNLAIDEGVTSVVGNNSAGKSSLLKGILFAMFGASAAGAKDHLWKWGADGEKSVGLAVTLPEHGRVTITRTPTGAKITTPDGRVLASGNTAVTKLIEESMGMASKDLRTLMYSPQGETQGLLTMGPTAMQQKVEGLAQMEVIDKVLGAVSTDINKYEGRLEGVPEAADPRELQAKIEEAVRYIEYQRKEIEGVRLQEVDANQQLTDAYARAADYRRVSMETTRIGAELNALKKRCDHLQEAYFAAERNLTTIPSVSQKQLDSMQAEIDDVSRKFAEATRQLRAEEKIQIAIDRATTMVRSLEARAENHALADKQLGPWNEKIAEVAAKVQQLSDLMNGLSQESNQCKSLLHDAVCPTCRRALEGVDIPGTEDKLRRIEAQREELRKEYTPLLDTLKDLRKQADEMRQHLNPAIAGMLAEQEAELVRLKTASTGDLNMLQVEEQHYGDRLSELTKTHEEFKRHFTTAAGIRKQQEELLAEREKIVQARVGLEAELATLPVVDVELADQAARALQDKVNQLRDLKQPFLVNLGRAESDLAGMQSELLRAEQAERELRKVREDKALAEDLQKFLRKNRTRLSADIWEGLLNYSSALISNTTGGVLTGLGRDNEGEFTVEELGRTVPVTEASGAQRSIIGLALRVALTKVFYGDKLALLLDEPTAEASDETAAAIAGMLSSLNMQIVSVTHRTGDSVNAGTIVEIR